MITFSSLDHTLRQTQGGSQRKALPVAQVEQRVADCYRTITLTPEQRGRVEQVALAVLHRRHMVDAERLDELTKQSQTVDANRVKLLDAHYADAIPRDVFLAEQRRLKVEQARIEQERAAIKTDLATLERHTRDALDLLQDVHATYQCATEAVRKQLNQSVFARVLLGFEPHQIRVELNEPYHRLAHPEDATND